MWQRDKNGSGETFAGAVWSVLGALGDSNMKQQNLECPALCGRMCWHLGDSAALL